MQRCLGEAGALDLPPEVLDAWLYGNAEAFFFGELERLDSRHPTDR